MSAASLRRKVGRAQLTLPRPGTRPQGGPDMPKGTPGRSLCSMDDCVRTVQSRGLCKLHWRRAAKQDPQGYGVQVCSVADCGTMAEHHQLCPTHLARWQRYGDPLIVHHKGWRGTPKDRFMAQVQIVEHSDSCAPDRGPCWQWTGHHLPDGYTQFSVDSHLVPAHRWAYEHWVGPIPAGWEVDHLCRIRHCVNPEHLEAVTRTENIRRSMPYRTRKASHAVDPE